MIKKLLLVFVTLFACLSVSADTYMRVVDKEGNLVFRVNADDVDYVDYEVDSLVFEHTYVDLGLPSGTLWATCNIGASEPEEYGDYFSWGETSTKKDYSSSTSFTGGKTNSDLVRKGVLDAKGNLTAKYDAATKQWGENWRMPTKTEFKELLDNCVWVKTRINSIDVYKVSSKVNSNSIIIPLAGERNGTTAYEVGSCGYYWSSTTVENDRFNAYRLYLYRSDKYMDSFGSRDYGRSVRPVYAGKEDSPVTCMRVIDKEVNIVFRVNIDDVDHVDFDDDSRVDD